MSYDILSSLNLGRVSKTFFLTKPGLAITAVNPDYLGGAGGDHRASTDAANSPIWKVAA